MPKRDVLHDEAKNALIKDGWTITADPFAIRYDDVDMFADLGAEKLFAAEKGTEKIVVEVKSFIEGLLFRKRLAQTAIQRFDIKVIVFDVTKEEIVRWIK